MRHTWRFAQMMFQYTNGEHSVTRAFELDDFRTEDWIIWNLFRVKGRVPSLKVTLFTLMNLSSRSTLRELAEYDWIEIAVHGWDHFSEWKWSYWEARHFLEMFVDIPWIQPIFKMPWNRPPSLGFLRALRELDWSFATSYKKRWQTLLPRFMGIPHYASRPSTIWCHPNDLLRDDFHSWGEPDFEFVSHLLRNPRRIK